MFQASKSKGVSLCFILDGYYYYDFKSTYTFPPASSNVLLILSTVFFTADVVFYL